MTDLPSPSGPKAPWLAHRAQIDRDALAWIDRAACRGSDPNLFFSDGSHDQCPEAYAVCAGCSVQSECAVYALSSREEHGVWGGLSPSARRRIRRRSLTTQET